MNSLDRSLNHYYRQVKSWVPCSHKPKTTLVTRLKESVQTYLEANPEADFPQIQAHFGTPETIATAYAEEMGTDKLLQDLRVRRKVVATVAGTMAVVLALWLGVVGWAVAREIKSSNNTIESYITEGTISEME